MSERWGEGQTVQTSLAQMFDELGNAVIIRGGEAFLDDKIGRKPHITSEQAYKLVKLALEEYKIPMENFPGRLVIHKSSKFTVDELDGLKKVVDEYKISKVDYVTILDSDIRFFRDGKYPPFRGTQIELEQNRYLLYTRGSVEFYKTYSGQYIPQPIEIRIMPESAESPDLICEEILALTKMNWNNTQFDGKYPITLSCARKVGEVMKYLSEDEKPQTKYGFYM